MHTLVTYINITIIMSMIPQDKSLNFLTLTHIERFYFIYYYYCFSPWPHLPTPIPSGERDSIYYF